ncbi:MAG: hypothetical protein LBO69_05555 [Ignavibacteria bacterium]|jgi:hypothetical protein|nr:hypothetical protein [Ignavibacteria bacterium]
MSDITYPTTRLKLLENANPFHYQTWTAETEITKVGTTAEIAIQIHNKPFWVTDMLAMVLDAKGCEVLESPTFPKDDLVVHINVAGVDFTNGSIPLTMLRPEKTDSPLNSGHLIDANQKIVFRFEAKRLRANPDGVCNYPLLLKVVLKGYEFDVGQR